MRRTRGAVLLKHALAEQRRERLVRRVQLGEQRWRDGEQVAAGERDDLTRVAERRRHNLRRHSRTAPSTSTNMQNVRERFSLVQVEMGRGRG